MASIDWFHSRSRLILPIVVMPPITANNASQTIHTTGLVDTGATGTGLRIDLAEKLDLRARGTRRVNTANGLVIASEYLVRIGFVCGDYRDPSFAAESQHPYVLDKDFIGFELQRGFAYPVLIGMDILGISDLTVRRDGSATLVLA